MLDVTPQPKDPRTDRARNRTSMAELSTKLALDRTTLAWLRTTLTMASFGFGMVTFFRSLREESSSDETIALHRAAIRFGTALILLGIAATFLAGLSHWFIIRRLRRGQSPAVNQWPLSIAVAMLSLVVLLLSLWDVFIR